jgi:hypothetical protein
MKKTIMSAVAALFTVSAHGKTAEQVYAEVSPSVLMVYSTSPTVQSQGSGVVIAASQVVTNCHVLQDDGMHVVVIGSRRYPASIQSQNRARDLCILRVANLSAKPVAQATRATRIGQKVYAIGNPQGFEGTLSDGLISSFRIQANGTRLIQTNVSISHGSSGGGLFNEEGQLLGITTSGYDGGASLNFAVPANYIGEVASIPSIAKQRAAEKAIADSIRPWISAEAAGATSSKVRLDDVDERIRYLNWLGEMSDRLRGAIPDMEVRRMFLEAVWYESKRAGLEPAMILGLIEVRSGFRRYQMSATGERGYMGIAPGWTKTIGDGDPNKLFHMQTNLRYGCSILRMYIDLNNGDLFLALGQFVGKRGQSQFPNQVLDSWKHWDYRGAALRPEGQ